MPYKAATLKPRGWIDPEKRRGNSAQRGYGYQWRKIRARVLEQHPTVRSAIRRHQIRLTTGLRRRVAVPMMRATSRRCAENAIAGKRR